MAGLLSGGNPFRAVKGAFIHKFEAEWRYFGQNK
jgi:hypothetical protein